MRNINFANIPDYIFGSSQVAINLKKICVRQSILEKHNYFEYVGKIIQEVNFSVNDLLKSNSKNKKLTLTLLKKYYLDRINYSFLQQKNKDIYSHLLNVVITNFKIAYKKI